MAETHISERLEAVRSRITSACTRFGRPVSEVKLLAVSKTKPVSMIEDAWHAGQRHFAENYLQEGLDKIKAVSVENIQWHYIGAIQSNKTRAIAENFTYVHTVASSRVARRLNDQRPDTLPPIKVLVQVNISGE
ncbi:MAG: YggS family pyridoxal phosphate-dependent enzyme, partial [Pseudomonadales bacterium]